jgi:hypothetical protein
MERWPLPGGFIEKTVRRTAYGATELAKEVDHLSLEHLEYLALIVTKKAIAGGMAANHTLVTLLTAIEMLRFFLGDAWTFSNAFDFRSSAIREHLEGREFLKSKLAGDSEAGWRYQAKVILLAEHLYNFQYIPGFKHRLGLLQHDNLEAAMGELECCSMMAHPQFNLRFIIPTGQKGADYDSEISLPGGRVACCEIKTKKERTDCTQETIRNTLESARKQLPKDRPGIIFLRVPENWLLQAHSGQCIESATAQTIRQSNKLVAIILVWEEWVQVGSSRAVFTNCQIARNTRSTQFAEDLDRALEAFGKLSNEKWFNLIAFITPRIQLLNNFAKAQWFSGDKPPGQHRD